MSKSLKEELTYEQAFKELESIVAALELEPKTLDETMKLFERGQVLAQFCGSLLDNAELKIKELTESQLAGEKAK